MVTAVEVYPVILHVEPVLQVAVGMVPVTVVKL